MNDDTDIRREILGEAEIDPFDDPEKVDVEEEEEVEDVEEEELDDEDDSFGY